MPTQVDTRSIKPMSLEETREFIAEAIEPLEAVRVELREARGRVLREEARTREDMPAFDRSAMDGYAVGPGERTRFRIAGEARPGGGVEFVVGLGECARIFTGAEIPQGAVKVVMQEDARVEDGWMTIVESDDDDHIRRRGEDALAGEVLLPAGTRLEAAEIGLLASLGIMEPLVSPRIRTVHFATGDELVDPGTMPGHGRIRDSNSSLVRAFAESNGDVMVHQERVPDDVEALVLKAQAALNAGCDVLLISGGASVGAYDFGRTALERMRFDVRFQKLNLRPGKPLVFATRGKQAAFVLPGNPLSHLAVLNCIVRVAFERMTGAESPPRMVHAELRAGIRIGGDGRDTLWPARVSFVDGEPVVDGLRWQSSGDITGLAGLNAFIRCSVPVLDTGARVPCILLHV